MKPEIKPGVLCYVVKSRQAVEWLNHIVEVVRVANESEFISFSGQPGIVWWVRASVPLPVPRYNRTTRKQVKVVNERETTFHETCLRPITGLPLPEGEEVTDLMEYMLLEKGHNV